MIKANYSPLVITKKGLFGAEIAKQYKYLAFGETKYESGTYSDTHIFTGKELDETGLYYFGARYYDKGIGRFLSTDPFPGYLSIPSTMHPYNYCANNPVNFVDPLGMGWPNDYWPPPHGAGEDCCDYLNRKYGNHNYAPAETEGNYEFELQIFLQSANEEGWRTNDALRDRNMIQLDAGDFVTENQKNRAFYGRLPRGRSMFKLERKLPLPFSVPMYLPVYTESVIGDVANEVYESGKFNEADKQQFLEFTSTCPLLGPIFKFSFGLKIGESINQITTITGAISPLINDKIGSPSPWGYGGTNMRRIKGGVLYNPVPPWGRPPLKD